MKKKILLSCIIGVLAIALCVTGTVLIVNKECSHTYGDWNVTLTANCESSGEREHVCSKCGEVEKSEVAALGHDWKDATCTEAKTCLRCGKTEGELGEHTFVLEDAKDETLKQAASCTSGAVYFKSCSVCGAISKNEADTFVFGDKLPHDFTKEDVKEVALKTPATCKDKAVYFKSCSVCGAVSDSEKDVFEHGDLLSHSFTKEDAKAEALKTPAGCSNAAIYYKSCETCGIISQNATDTFSFGEPSGHSFTREIANDSTKAWDATCTSPKTYYKSCALCGTRGTSATFMVGEALGHTFNQETISKKTLKVEATCQSAAKYAKSCETCGAVSNSEADYFENGEKAQCSYVTPAEADMKEYLEKEGVLVAAADCENKAVYLKFCKWCEKISEDKINTFEYGDALGHDYSKADVKEGASKTDATCTDNATYYKSCSKCGKIGSDETFENKNSALGHSYVDDDENSAEATCTAPAKKAHKCDRCGDTYSEDVGGAKGHVKGEPLEGEQIGNTCEYKTAYTCSVCGETVDGDNVFKHTYVAKITKAATCQADGEKTLTCSNCRDVREEKIEKDEKNGHVWNQGDVVDGKRTDTCSVEGCGATKTVVVYDTNNADNISSKNLNEEIALKDASFKLSEAAVNGLGDKNVSLSMSTLTDEERANLNVDDKKMKQVGNNPIYNFNMSEKAEGGEDQAISSFDGNITITIPYELGENEDVDSIAVWYITANGDLECIEAVYNNGYITFTTNHFSYYTVTRLTVEERCDRYGHNEVRSEINGGCLKDSYTLYTCVRCHKERKENVVSATWHNYSESTEAATCVKNGKITYTCQNAGCGYSYTETILATGHSYEKSNRKDATCQAEGFIEYECKNEGCESKYTEVLSKKGHELVTEVTAPTCAASGYTKYFCKNEGCDYTYNKDYVAALGHTYDFDDPEKTVWNWSVENQSQAGAMAGVTAEVEFRCTVCSHSEKLTAGVSFKIKYGKCSGYVKTTFTAAVMFAGDIRSDEYEIVIGDENHKFSQNYKYDDDNHWHECVCGEKDEVAAHVFENGVVKKQATCGADGEMVYTCVCGAKKSEVIPATGEHSFKDGVCEVCGNKTFYTNLLSSHVTNNSYVFTIKNLSLYNVSVDMDGNVETTKILEQVDVIWLTLYNENGELKGEGEFSVTGVYLGTLRCSAYIENGFVYISASAESADGTTDSVLCKMTTEYLAEQLFGSIFGSGIKINDESVKALKVLYQKAIGPALNVLVKTNGDKVESVLSGLFEMAFTREKTAGGYKLTLDYAKLSALNEALAEKTFAEVIDLYFGEGSFEKAVDEIIEVLDLTPNRFVKILSDAGLDSDEFFDALNEVFDLIYGAGFDDEWFADYGESTFGNLVFNVADDSYISLINNAASMLKENSIYALICGEGGVSAAKRNVDDVIKTLEKWVGLSITTNGNGRLVGLDLEVEGFADSIDADVNVVASDKKPEFTLGGLVGEVDGAIVAPSGEIAETLGYDVDVYYNCYTSEWEHTISFGSEVFYSVKEISVEKYVRGNYISAQANSYCKDWVYIQENYQTIEYWLRYYFAADNTVLLTDGKTYLKLSQTENGFILTNDDGTSKAVTLVLPDSSAFDSTYEYRQALAKAYEKVALEFIDNPYVYNRYSYGWIFNYCYYYNVKTGEHSLEDPHSYETTYKFLGNDKDCSDGVEIIETCTICGEKSSYTTYGHYSFYNKEVNIEGFCGLTVTERYCTVCDNYIEVYFESSDCNFKRSGYTEEGNPIYTCETCGGSYYECRVTSEKDVNNNCEYTVTDYLVLLKDGEEVYRGVVNEDTGSDHNYIYEVSGGEGEACEDCGYIVTRTCADCGYSYSDHEYYSHYYVRIESDLKDKGFCGVYLREYKCVRCEKEGWSNFGYGDCDFSRSGETEEGYSIYTCKTCGGSYYRYTVTSEKDVNNYCEYTETYYWVFLKDGEEVYRAFYGEYTSSDHDYGYEFDRYGEACEDGYKVTATCKDCGYVNEYESTQHTTYQVFELGEGDWCDRHFLRVEACPCGYNFAIYTNDNYSSGETSKTCETCGLTLKSFIEEQQSETCLVNKKTSIVLSFGDEVLYSWENKGFNYHDHEFGSVQIKTDEDGISYISNVCSKCGEELASSIVKNSTLALNDRECEFDFTVSEEESNYVFLFDRYVYIRFFSAESGEYVYGHGYDNYCSISLSQGEYKVRVVADENCEELNLVVFKIGGVLDNYVRGAYCRHYTTETTKLLLNGDSCENGVLIYGACPFCGTIRDLDLNYEHNTYWEYIDLSEYGVCEGSYVQEYHCACFEVVDRLGITFNGCDYQYFSDKNVDAEGKTIYAEGRYCTKCGLLYQRSYYDVYDEENCQKIRYYTEIVSVNKVLIAECSYENYYDAHNYDVTYELLGGEGSSCEDGVKITYTCKNCGDSYTRTSKDHDAVIVKENIDLSAYGSVCGGNFVIKQCPCGYNVSGSFADALCEFDAEWIYDYDYINSIEGIIDEDQFNSSGYVYGSTKNIWEYTCAVTDPACGFKIRRICYYKKAETECKAYYYVRWQFGYDDESGTCKLEREGQTSDVIQWHTYKKDDDSSDNGVNAYICSVCKSTYTERNYTDEQGRNVYEKIAENALENEFNKSCSHVEIYTYDEEKRTTKWEDSYTYVRSDGTEYFSRNTREYIYHNGIEYESCYLVEVSDRWYRYDYTYDFTNSNGEGCIRTCVYTNSDGVERKAVENCCRYELNDENIIKYPTCTQAGSIKVVCRACNIEIIAELRALANDGSQGHNFIKLENGKYFCFRCGIENENGADGSIVLEDLTESYGNGEYYVAGYYKNSGALFTNYVSLILSDGNEIELENVDFEEVEGLTAIKFSKAQIKQLAEQKGVTGAYDVRFAFVPFGLGGSLDYAITFTEEIEETVTEITSGGSFLCYKTSGENLKITITPSVSGTWSFTSASNGDTYAYLYDENGKSIAYDFFGGEGLNFLLSYELEEGKTYTLEIGCYSSGGYYGVYVSGKIDAIWSFGGKDGGYMGIIVTAPEVAE